MVAGSNKGLDDGLPGGGCFRGYADRGENGNLVALEVFFHQDLPAGASERSFFHEAFKRTYRFFGPRGNNDTLSCGESVSLDHDRPVDAVNRGDCAGQIGMGFAFRAGDPVLFHEGLRDILARFEHGGFVRRAHHPDAGFRKTRGKAGGKRVLGSYDHKGAFVRTGEFAYAGVYN